MSEHATEKVVDTDLVEKKHETALVKENSETNEDQLSSPVDEDEGRTPTNEEMKTLRHVSEKIPIRCWLVAIVELAERFSYYGLSAPFQNYMQYDKPKGMLNLSQQGATALSYFFQFWCYVTPVLGAWVADTYWGKLNTIIAFSLFYTVGILILFVTSLPSMSETTALGGFIVAIIIIGIGTGGVKSNVSPLIADQVPKTLPVIKVLKSGERVVQDPNVTIQNVFMYFYLMINIGSLSVIATTELEYNVGFWAAYLLPFCFFFIAIGALIIGRKQYVQLPVSEKVIAKSFKISFIGLKNKFNLDVAKPSVSPEMDYPWSDKFVEEVKRAFYACKVFAFYPLYWVVYGQMLNNFVSQAAQMETHNLPNDILQAINSIAIIIFIPVCERLVYPFIRRFTPFKAITKITMGYMFATGAMIYAAVLQHYIYSSGPCYDEPLKCAGYEGVPNHVHVAIQAPAYFLIAMSEIFASITGLEYAYTKAPVSMKSFITSLFLLTNAIGSAIGIALSSTSEDPKLVWNYTGLAVSCFLAGTAFWFIFKHYNYREDELNNLDYVDDNGVPNKNRDLQPITSFAFSGKSIA